MKVGDYVYCDVFGDMVIKVNESKCKRMPTTRIRAISEDGQWVWVNWCCHKIARGKVTPVKLDTLDEKFFNSYTFAPTQVFEDLKYLYNNKETTDE